MEKFTPDKVIWKQLRLVFGSPAVQKTKKNTEWFINRMDNSAVTVFDDDGSCRIFLPQNAPTRQVVHEFAHAYCITLWPDLMTDVKRVRAEAVAIMAEAVYSSRRYIKRDLFETLASEMLYGGRWSGNQTIPGWLPLPSSRAGS